MSYFKFKRWILTSIVPIIILTLLGIGIFHRVYGKSSSNSVIAPNQRVYDSVSAPIRVSGDRTDWTLEDWEIYMLNPRNQLKELKRIRKTDYENYQLPDGLFY